LSAGSVDVLPASASEALSVMVSPPVEAARGTTKFRERAIVRGLYFPPSWGFHPADLRAHQPSPGAIVRGGPSLSGGGRPRHDRVPRRSVGALRPGGLDPPDHAAVRVWSVKSIGAFIRTSPDAALAKGAPVDRQARLRVKAIRTRDRNPSDALWLAELQKATKPARWSIRSTPGDHRVVKHPLHYQPVRLGGDSPLRADRRPHWSDGCGGDGPAPGDCSSPHGVRFTAGSPG
jgi:hypothetical protein